MKIAIAGITGLIGRQLEKSLKKHGHDVVAILHDGERLILNDSHKDVDAVINLSGVNIMQKWTPEFKTRVMNSRVNTAKQINHFYDQFSKKPKVLLSASAIGYYGHQPGETLVESSPKGEGFLSDLVDQWESATRDSAISRVVCFRMGVVLSNDGGALPKIIKGINLYLGAILGNPQSYMSWIHIDDVLKAFTNALEQNQYKGIYNLVSEQSVTQECFMKTLAKRLHRRIFLKLPQFIVNLIFGEAAEVITNDAKVYPKKLKQTGFDFSYPDLDSALYSLVKLKP